MSELGCSVYAYDHTISAPPERGERIMFTRLGLGVMEDMDTLDNIIDNNNHADTTIEYLKVGYNKDMKIREMKNGWFDWIFSVFM